MCCEYKTDFELIVSIDSGNNNQSMSTLNKIGPSALLGF